MAKEIDKRTQQLGKGGMQKGDNPVAQSQQVSNHLQTINAERKRNLDVEMATANADNANTETLAQAGEMVAGSGGAISQVAQMNPQTQAVLGKYGLGTKRSQCHSVQTRPNNITINNTYNTTTTNNIAGGGVGPLQGRAISFKQTEQQQSRFKTWVSSVFASQRERNLQRTREYEKRESSLSKQANKMLKRLEDLGRTISSSYNPQAIGTTLGGQIKTFLFLFGTYFLTKHFKTIVKWVMKGVSWLDDTASYFGLGDRGRQLVAGGGGFRGDLMRFLGADPTKKDQSVFSVLKEVFSDLKDYLKMRFEHAMEERGMALKAVKFPKLDFSGVSSEAFGESIVGKIMGKAFGGFINSMGTILTTSFNGLGAYMKDIFTAIVNPKQGLINAAQAKVKSEAMENSQAAAERRGESSMFDEIDSDTMAGDYSLEKKGANGRRKYSLMQTAVGTDGRLTGTASSTISQGRDILGAIRDAKEYGRVDTGRVYAGLTRLKETAEDKGKVVIDKEFVDTMFGGEGQKLARSGSLKKVRMKYVVDDLDMMEKYHQNIHLDQEHSAWGRTGEIIGAGAGFLFGAGKAKAAWSAAKGAGALAKGKAALKGAGQGVWSFGKGDFLGSVGGNVVESIMENLYEKDKTLRLVPEDDPRPAAVVGGKRLASVDYYEASPAAIDALMKHYDPEGTGQASTVMGNIEKHLVAAGGGKANIDRTWNLKGSNSGYFEGQKQYTNIDELTYQEKSLSDMQKAHRAEEEALYNRRLGVIENNGRQLINRGIDGVNGAIGWANGKINSIIAAKNATFAYEGKAPGVPNENAPAFNAQAAASYARQHAGPISKKACAEHVRKAIAAGFGEPGKDIRQMFGDSDGVSDAKSYAGYLPKLGFVPLDWSSYRYAKPGDVLVQPSHPGGSKEGHMSIFDGQSWDSDFIQRNMWGGSGYEKLKKGVVFRHLSQLDGTEKRSLGVANGTVQAMENDDVPVSSSSAQANPISEPYSDSGYYQPQYTGGNFGYYHPQGTNESVYVAASGGAVSPTSFGKVDIGDNIKTAMDYLMNRQGLTKEQAAGIVGNLQAESSMNPSTVAMDTNRKYSYGIAQFNSDEYTKGKNSLFAYAASKGAKWDDLLIQLEYALQTPKGSKALEKIRQSNSAKDASFLWGNIFEVFGPNGAYKDPNSGEHLKRANYAEQIASGSFKGGTFTSVQNGSSEHSSVASMSSSPTANFEEPVVSSGGETSPINTQYNEGGEMAEGEGIIPTFEHLSEPEQMKLIDPTGEASRLWYTMKNNDIVLPGHSDDFDNWAEYWSGLSGRQKSLLKQRIEGASSIRDRFTNMDVNKKRILLGSGTEKDFRKMYNSLESEKDIKNVDAYIDQVENSQLLKEYLENADSDIISKFRKLSHGRGASTVYDEIVRGEYKPKDGEKYSDDEKKVIASITQGKEYNALTKKIEDLEEKLSSVGMTDSDLDHYAREYSESFNARLKKLGLEDVGDVKIARFQLNRLKHQRDSFGKSSLIAEDGSDKSQVGYARERNKKIESINQKLAENEFNQRNFEEYFNEKYNGKTLNYDEYVEAMNKERQFLLDQHKAYVEQLEGDLKVSKEEMEKRAKAREAQLEKAEKEAKRLKDGEKKIKEKFEELLKSEDSYYDAVSKLHSEYNDKVLNLLGLSINDLQKNYKRTADAAFEKLSSFQKFIDARIDYQLGKINEGEYKKILLDINKEQYQGQIQKDMEEYTKKPEVKKGDGSYLKVPEDSHVIKGDVTPWQLAMNKKGMTVGDGKSPIHQAYGSQLKKKDKSWEADWTTTGGFAEGGWTPDLPADTPLDAKLHGGELVLPKWFNVEFPEISSKLGDFISLRSAPLKVTQENGYRDNSVPDFIKRADEVASGKKTDLFDKGLDSETFKTGIGKLIDTSVKTTEVLVQGHEAICQTIASSGGNRIQSMPHRDKKSNFPRNN